MSDTTQGMAAPSRKQVSIRGFIDTDGNEVDRMEEATGAVYELRGGKSFSLQFGDAGDPRTMFAIFGFHTKVGNVANTVLNDKSEPGDVDDAATAIDEFLDKVQKHEWMERSSGGGGFQKIDLDALAEAMTLAAAEKGFKPGDDAAQYKARARAVVEDKGKRTAYKRLPDVGAHYARLTGAKVANVDLGAI